MLSPDLAAHLVSRHGSPLYVYQAEQIEARHRELRALLPHQAVLLYSFKANPLPGIVAQLRECGCRAEVSSPYEMEVARDAGFDLSEALYTGPGKTEAELSAALAAGVGFFSCESAEEVSWLARSGAARSRILLRVNPRAPATPGLRSAGLSMSASGRQFGFEEGELAEPLSPAVAERVVGFHVYQGTQMEVGALPTSFELARAACLRVSQTLGIEPRVMDLGGGFPWPFATAAPEPDLGGAREALARLASSGPGEAGLWFESGRFLTASSGTLVATVQNVKRRPGAPPQVILDSGINHLGGMSGLRRLPLVDAQLLLPSRPGAEPVRVDLFGPLCTPLDCLSRGAALPRLPERGELLSIPNVGAYGLTASLFGFLGRSPPIEVLVRGEQILAIHRLRSGHQALVDTEHNGERDVH